MKRARQHASGHQSLRGKAGWAYSSSGKQVQFWVRTSQVFALGPGMPMAEVALPELRGSALPSGIAVAVDGADVQGNLELSWENRRDPV